MIRFKSDKLIKTKNLYFLLKLCHRYRYTDITGDVPTEDKSSNMIQVGFKGGALKKQGAYSKIPANIERRATPVEEDSFKHYQKAQLVSGAASDEQQQHQEPQKGSLADINGKNTGSGEKSAKKRDMAHRVVEAEAPGSGLLSWKQKGKRKQ